MSTYIESQFEKACPLPLYPENKNGQIKIKIHSERGESNWLNITAQQMIDIETLLNSEA